ncbi:hypothetical protein EDD85DRAFT_798593 [Armillaria nabsnona]|nr:hypothetical protein EDD85DRAFT_798593 [Armillaria nabsnona]
MSFDAGICRRTHATWRLELNTRFPREIFKGTVVICGGRYWEGRSDPWNQEIKRLEVMHRSSDRVQGLDSCPSFPPTSKKGSWHPVKSSVRLVLVSLGTLAIRLDILMRSRSILLKAHAALVVGMISRTLPVDQSKIIYDQKARYSTLQFNRVTPKLLGLPKSAVLWASVTPMPFRSSCLDSPQQSTVVHPLQVTLDEGKAFTRNFVIEKPIPETFFAMLGHAG